MSGYACATRARIATLLAASVVVSLALVLVAGSERAAGQPAGSQARDGSFGAPFEEPFLAGRRTGADCIERAPRNAAERRIAGPDGKYVDCKPAAVSANLAPNGKIPYWNGLEGTENIGTEDGVPDSSIATEFGAASIDDQTRELVLGARKRWIRPRPLDGGGNPNGAPDPDPLIPGNFSRETYNDGSLFCSDQNWLPDGRVMAVGGSLWMSDPGNNLVRFGPTELQGLRNSRILNPRNDRWTQTGNMKRGRWYPSLVTLANGDQFVASGVHKLVKPVYPRRITESGRNVTHTETFDHTKGRWRLNGPSAQRSLPLFPRLHLLPNGHVYYDAAGQAFNPWGQAVDQAGWHIAASYNPRTQRWRDLGVPGLTTGATLDPGFRGSTFSAALPLKPDARGRYTKAEFLTGGGVPSAFGVGTSPGAYFPTKSSRIATVDTARRNHLTTRATGPLTQPHPSREPGDLPLGRWYASATVLPTGEVLATAGADRDEVAFPGIEREIKTAEIFDPKARRWRAVAAGRKPRTYHNTAVLLPDGRVLIGGHATLTTGYGDNSDVPGSAPNGRDPSFEIYSPPYLFRGARPAIRQAPSCARYGRRMQIETDVDARQVESVALVRNASVTHIVDGDQKSVELRVVRRKGRRLTVAAPPSGNVAPPGPYLLFVNKRTPKGLVPSVAKQVAVGAEACRTFGRNPRAGGAGGDKTAIFDQRGSGGGLIQQDGPGDEFDRHENAVAPAPAGGSGGPGGGAGGLVAAMLLVAGAAGVALTLVSRRAGRTLPAWLLARSAGA